MSDKEIVALIAMFSMKVPLKIILGSTVSTVCNDCEISFEYLLYFEKLNQRNA